MNYKQEVIHRNTEIKKYLKTTTIFPDIFINSLKLSIPIKNNSFF